MVQEGEGHEAGPPFSGCTTGWSPTWPSSGSSSPVLR